MRTLTQSDYPGRWWMMLPDGRVVPAATTMLLALLHHGQIFCLLRPRCAGRSAIRTNFFGKSEKVLTRFGALKYNGVAAQN